MKLNIPKCMESFLLRGYKEFRSNEDHLTIKEEQTLVARLVCGLQVQLFGMSEYKAFGDYKTFRSELKYRCLIFFPMAVCFYIVFSYGLLNFIIIEIEDDAMKIQVLAGLFSAVDKVAPLFLWMSYVVQSKNMFDLVQRYVMSGREMSLDMREFYRKLTLRLNFIQKTVQINTAGGFVYHYFHKSFCFHSDPRFVCRTFTPLWFPFATNFFPAREVICIFITCTISYLSLFLIYPTLNSYVIAELLDYKVKHLIKLIQETSLNRARDIQNIRASFKRIVDYHQEIQECFVLAREIIGVTSIPIVLGAAPFIAALSTSFLLDPNYAHMDELLTIFVLVYLWCDSSQKITDLGGILAEEVYAMDWYEMDVKLKSDFVLFLHKVQQPVEMKSLFFILNKPLLLSLGRSMYSVLMLILNKN
ncbi:uncharacterized protein LOC123319066 [Coccinella septempunctata]|uniref:uncharacterized protein LOC123319066 n=1 Tax=Coccinella septempunctata TaxID=41139 RepID=UPI001D060359|nr:uncharacterized protein LOC123319066 [Coccinella septempunctata]